VAVALFFTWHASSITTTPPGITQQNINGTSSSANSSTSTTNSGDIQVYVTGAVKHPGVYTLPSDARIFQLLQAAGGTLPNANLVALNLASKLTDGEEVYQVEHNIASISGQPSSYIDSPSHGEQSNSVLLSCFFNRRAACFFLMSIHSLLCFLYTLTTPDTNVFPLRERRQRSYGASR
jgi:competence protein ComEA